MKTEPILSFEFSHSDGKIIPYTFQNPHRVITAYTIEEVEPCLRLVEDAVEQGFYAAGFLSYESAPAFDPAYMVHKGNKLPLLWFGIFQEPDHLSLNSSGTYSLSEWKPSIEIEEYNAAIDSIKQSIEDGVTYQINYTIRLTSQFQGDEMAFFEKLKRGQTSNYCAYLHTGDHSILSASPELFFHLKGDKIVTRPMKGTVKRGKTLNEDITNANWLYHSEKNRAENVMIVDLLRNDLGMIAEPGTVEVESLFDIEQYPTVHQMTSTISAQVSEQVTIFDVFKALFPCGSITGAPKVSTMNIIAELETAPREVYCGAIGFITPQKEAVFNVPIRTVIIDQHSGEATYGVGGGVTWDSTAEGEYQEILAKAKLLSENRPPFQLLESILLENGTYFLLAEHLKRLEDSAQYFGFIYKKENVEESLQQFAMQNQLGCYKVRLLLSRDGSLIMEGQSIMPMDEPLQVMVAKHPIDKNSPFLYHKTTNRMIYSDFQQNKPKDVFDVLLWNESGELTEFTNGNIVIEMDGQYWTPPVESGLLAGTYRNRLIKSGKIHEKILTKADLKKCTRVCFINSVRKWIDVQVQEH
ncbi:aminodeoxychorismate synthase component I [Neobacillus sp. LXY-1]|uniref:aminodeoxychorismate synthase component I n=1 Tax=Neobacillus sp. LXY-1 TaxID=3379133 RepID=UPI003EDEC872